MKANYVQRLRIHFGKDGPARYIGHLDLARTIERAFNRAGWPVSYSQGYNRRPRLQFATATPLGFTSEFELADVWMRERVLPAEAQAALAAVTAPGIPIFAVWEVPLGEPALQMQTRDSTYLVSLSQPPPGAGLAARVDDLLASNSLPRERRGKPFDLRPQILSLVVEDVSRQPTLRMTLTLLPGQTGRPDQVVEALGLDPLAAHVHRVGLTYGAAAA